MLGVRTPKGYNKEMVRNKRILLRHAIAHRLSFFLDFTSIAPSIVALSVKGYGVSMGGAGANGFVIGLPNPHAVSAPHRILFTCIK